MKGMGFIRLIGFGLSVFILGCSSRFDGETKPWAGDDKSVKAAEAMLKKLGGRDRWAGMTSLYVRYEQEDAAFGSFPSIQIQSLGESKIIVDQYISNQRLIRIMDGDSAWIENNGYLDSMNETVCSSRDVISQLGCR